MANFFSLLDVPAADGNGRPLDVSATGASKTFVFTGTVPNGAVYGLDISQDGNSYDRLINLAGQNQPQTLSFIAKFVRIHRKAAGATPVIGIGADLPAAPVAPGATVTDVHVAGNRPITGSVELAAGANATLTQNGNQIVVDAVIPPAPPSGGTGERSIFFDYTHDAIAAGAGQPETLFYQHCISYGAMLPSGNIIGFLRGIYSLDAGTATVRLRRDENNQVDATVGKEIGSVQLAATGGLFTVFGFDPTDLNGFGVVLMKVTVELSGGATQFRMKGVTLKLMGGPGGISGGGIS